MFNLESSIADWRRQMLAAGITTAALGELESHLREEIERQRGQGADVGQAFGAAVMQMGAANELRSEFEKENGTGRKVIWLLLTGIAFAGCWLQFGWSPALACVYGVLLAGLIAAAFIDFKHFIIPDKITLGGILAGFLCSMWLPQLHGQKDFMAGMLQSLLGIGAGAGLLYFILRMGKLLFGRQHLTLPDETRIIFTEVLMRLPGKEIAYDELFYRKSDVIELHARSVKLGNHFYQNVPIRLTAGSLQIGHDHFNPAKIPYMEVVSSQLVLPREAMGFGDVKFMAAIGAFLGWQAVIFSLVVGSLIGSLAGMGLIMARRREWSARLPFGPCLALAAVIWVFGCKYFVGMMFGQ